MLAVSHIHHQSTGSTSTAHQSCSTSRHRTGKNTRPSALASSAFLKDVQFVKGTDGRTIAMSASGPVSTGRTIYSVNAAPSMSTSSRAASKPYDSRQRRVKTKAAACNAETLTMEDIERNEMEARLRSTCPTLRAIGRQQLREAIHHGLRPQNQSESFAASPASYTAHRGSWSQIDLDRFARSAPVARAAHAAPSSTPSPERSCSSTPDLIRSPASSNDEELEELPDEFSLLAWQLDMAKDCTKISADEMWPEDAFA